MSWIVSRTLCTFQPARDPSGRALLGLPDGPESLVRLCQIDDFTRKRSTDRF